PAQLPSFLVEDGYAGLRAKTVFQEDWLVRCTSVRPSGLRGGFVYDVPAAKEVHWYRGGSTASSLCGNEAQTLGSPVPTPVPRIDRWIHELDHRSTAWSSPERWLLLHSETKTDSPTFDDDGLSPFCCIEEK